MIGRAKEVPVRLEKNLPLGFVLTRWLRVVKTSINDPCMNCARNNLIPSDELFFSFFRGNTVAKNIGAFGAPKLCCAIGRRL